METNYEFKRKYEEWLKSKGYNAAGKVCNFQIECAYCPLVIHCDGKSAPWHEWLQEEADE